MFTVSMAIGSMELAKKGVLITTLSASENAATMNVLCADKTGTITMNRLSIAKVIPLNEFTEQQVCLWSISLTRGKSRPNRYVLHNHGQTAKPLRHVLYAEGFRSFRSENRKS